MQALSRALDLLEVLSRHDDGCRLKDLCWHTRLPASTLHRLLTTMQQRQFVRFDRASYTWTIGSRALVVGAAFLRRRQLVSSATPHMKMLAESADATVSLSVIGSDDLIVLHQAFAPRSGIPPIAPGSHLMLHVSAMGKVLLAAQPRANTYKIPPLRRLTGRTITEPSLLVREVDAVARQGFALDDEESETGKRCVAVPIYDELGRIAAAISVTARKSRLSDRRLPDMISSVAAAGRDITVAYGGHIPSERSG